MACDCSAESSVLRRRNCESALSLTWVDSASERIY
jgi:hypothetical protein